MPVDLGNTPFDLPDFNTGPLAQPEIQPEIIDEEDLEMVRCHGISLDI